MASLSELNLGVAHGARALLCARARGGHARLSVGRVKRKEKNKERKTKGKGKGKWEREKGKGERGKGKGEMGKGGKGRRKERGGQRGHPLRMMTRRR